MCLLLQYLFASENCVFVTKVPSVFITAVLCMFITAVHFTKLFARVGGGDGGHVLRKTTSRGRCELVCPSRTKIPIVKMRVFITAEPTHHALVNARERDIV